MYKYDQLMLLKNPNIRASIAVGLGAIAQVISELISKNLNC
ncbi:MAG: hypothetical protein QNJ55_28210 [Xenococcus sp. MO_188.B8]|nr:hypothetical protein [Xenococcus sp. MO_188.B8]